MKKFVRVVLSLVLCLCVSGINAQRFTQPEVRVEKHRGASVIYMIDEYHFPYDVSDNGQHVAIQGFGEFSSYYWSEASGLVPMDGYAFAISDNGVIAGYYMDETLNANVAGMWFPDMQEWTFLGMNPDAPQIVDMEYNNAWAMTNDGTKLAVFQITPEWDTFSYLWSDTDGYVLLDTPGSLSTRPMALNADASVVAGHAVADMGWVPCYWNNGVYHDFGDEYFGEAMAVSDNGNYIAGYIDGAIGAAFLYDISADAFHYYENPNGQGSMSATCVNNNGEIFGYTASGFPPMPDSRRAFAIVDGQYMTFNEYLSTNGFEDASDWTFYSINSVTANGKTFSGAANINGVDYSLIITLEDSDCDGPTNLIYTIDEVNYDDVDLSWEAPANPVDVTYEIYSGYTASEPLVAGITETTYTFEDLEPGTYSYIVKANWGGECLSAGSNMVTPTVYSCPSSEMCSLTVELSDQYGDGWNGAYFEIKGSEGRVLYKVELTNGHNQVMDLPFCSDNLTFTWFPAEFDSESGFTISKDGEVLYTIEAITEPLGTFLEYDLVCYDNVEEIEIEDVITIAPNPANNYFSINGENISNVEIINSLGQTIELINVNGNEVQVNTSDYENGVYFVKVITTDHNTTIQRVVISK